MRSRSVVLSAVLTTSLGVGVIFGLEAPLIAIVLSRAGHGSAAVGVVNSMGLAAVILIGPAYPRLIARLGLKHAILTGISSAVLILLLMPVWIGVPSWLLLRFFTGCVLGLAWIASEIWLNTVAGGNSRGTVMGIYGMVFSTGTAAGPLLLEITGTNGWAPFLAGAAFLALTLAPLLVLPNTPRPAGDQQPLGRLVALLPAAPLIMLAAFTAGFVESADLSLLPVFGLRSGLGERDALWLIGVFLAGNVVLQLPIGLLADRFGRRLLLGVCALASCLGPAFLHSFLHTPALLWPLLFVWGGTLYAFYSQGVALLGECFGAGQLAGTNTVFVMVYCLGGIIGPSAGGFAMDLWFPYGLPGLLSAAAAVMLIGVLLLPNIPDIT
jgi:MFS family permease